MNPEQQRIAIAEACGMRGVWEKKITSCGCDGQWDYFNPQGNRLPDYCNDLNAMHEAEKTLDFEQAELFEDELCDVTFKNNKRLENPPPWRFSVCHATARQRAEAFLKTINKWEAKP